MKKILIFTLFVVVLGLSAGCGVKNDPVRASDDTFPRKYPTPARSMGMIYPPASF